jgi:hypothetical protein
LERGQDTLRLLRPAAPFANGGAGEMWDFPLPADPIGVRQVPPGERLR